MDQEPDDIRRRMRETRASIDDRIEQLECKARQLHPRNYLGWIALGAVVVSGSIATVRLLRG